ncbi:PriCT-2 domain-containing protein [Aromatoleum diolicum]|nr:PriCT-2 domain-containing protein [Aromatoleum diolicum]
MVAVTYPPDTPERVASALSFLDASDRDTWVCMSFATKDALGEAGRDVWMEWARSAENFDERGADATWRSAKVGGQVRAASLFHAARQAGWRDDSRRVAIDPAEAERRGAERAERDARAAAEVKAERKEAAARAVAIWNAAKQVTYNAYLRAKGIRPHGTRVGPWEAIDRLTGEVKILDDAALLIPAQDFDGQIWTIEAVLSEKLPDGRNKLFLRGGAKAGRFFRIGDRPVERQGRPIYVLAEGFATGASIHECTGHHVLVAFDCGNLAPVARELRRRHPEATILFAADNDQFTPRNPGVDAARKAAAEVGGLLAVPQFASLDGDPTDFNDLHQREGAVQVIEQVVAGLKSGRVEPEAEAAPAGDERRPGFAQVLEETEPAAVALERMPEPSGSGRDDDVALRAGFLILGYDRELIFVYSRERRQVITTTVQRLSREAGLIELADLLWWEMQFTEPGKDFKPKVAANWIARIAGRRGVYESDRVRGRGAWWDDGRLVFHLGDQLIVDGVPAEIDSFKSRFVFEARPALMAPSAVPLNCREGEDLLRVARMFRWEHPGAAELLMGWLFLAPICGMLRWRPHVWVGASPGAGKSTLMDSFVMPLLPDRWALHELGMTTEAALRQKLAADARPVLLDEFEANTEADRRRVEGVLTLIRLSSSSGEISRGTVSGRALTFTARSMFLLASVGVGLHRQTDEDRITRLELTKNGGGADRWPELEAELVRLTRDRSVAQRLFARALGRLALVREAVEVFTREAGAILKSQRHGDQYGTLLAGCWCLTHDAAPTVAEARAKIMQHELAEFGAGASASGDDSSNALNAILSAVIRLDGGKALTVSQLIEIATLPSGYEENPSGLLGVSRKEADHQLQLHGIRVRPSSGSDDNGEVMFAMAHRHLLSLVADTDFATDLIGRLARLTGAWKSREGKPKAKLRFAGATLRYVAVPLSLCVSTDDDAGLDCSVIGSSLPRHDYAAHAPF